MKDGFIGLLLIRLNLIYFPVLAVSKYLSIHKMYVIVYCQQRIFGPIDCPNSQDTLSYHIVGPITDDFALLLFL